MDGSFVFVKFVPASSCCRKLEVTMEMQKTRRATQQMHIMFGSILKFQITLQQRRADPRMLFARFARNPSVAAALPEPLHISWRCMGQDFLLLHKSSTTFTQTPK
jgi:hypothetical protein